MGPNAKELFRLVEDFVDVIGFRMKDLRDAYQVTDNLGKPRPRTADPQPRHAPAVQPWPGARRLPLLVRVHLCARAVAGPHPPGQPPRWVSSFRCIDLKLWASDPDAVPETLNLGCTGSHRPQPAPRWHLPGARRPPPPVTPGALRVLALETLRRGRAATPSLSVTPRPSGQRGLVSTQLPALTECVTRAGGRARFLGTQEWRIRGQRTRGGRVVSILEPGAPGGAGEVPRPWASQGGGARAGAWPRAPCTPVPSELRAP